MAIIKAINTSGKGLKRCIDYVLRKGKLEDTQLLGIGCNPRTAYNEMMLTKEMYNKTKGIEHLHLVLSLSPDESRTTSTAKLLELTENVLSNSSLFSGYQTLVAVHQDKQHLHAHIVVNSVSDVSGKKVQFFKHQLKDLKLVLADVGAEYGIGTPTKGQSKVIGGQGAIRQVIDKTIYDPDTKEFYYAAGGDKVKSWESEIAYKVKTTIKESRSKEEYLAKLEAKGVTVSRWKDTGDKGKDYITYCMEYEGKTKKVKNKRLEDVFHLDFSVEGVHNELERNAQLDSFKQQNNGTREGARTGTQAEQGEAAEINKQLERIAERIERARKRASRNRNRAKLFAIAIRARRLREHLPKLKQKPKQRVLVRIKHRGY